MASRPSAARVAQAYRLVDQATRTKAAEPLWLPAGWLAVLLLLSASVPSFGAEASSDGWRARGTVSRNAERRSNVPARAEVRSNELARSGKSNLPKSADGWASQGGQPHSAIRQVAFEDDIAGPSLRTAGRMSTDRFMDGEYRVAQQDAGENGFGDTLQDSFERPFGVPDAERPAEEDAEEDFDADTADSLFDEPPTEEPPMEEEPAPEPDLDEFERAPRESIFDDEPAITPRDDDRASPEQIPPGDIADDLARTREDDEEEESAAKVRRQARENCSEDLADLKARRLSSIDLNIRVTGSAGEDYPYNCTLEDGTIFAPRCWSEITYMWKASGLCHKPLYFEDEALERYGHSWGPYVQPLVSGAHFFGTLPVLPYKMGLKTPDECVYALGHYRPGNCAPYLIDPVPFTWRAAIFQAGGAVGVAAFLP